MSKVGSTDNNDGVGGGGGRGREQEMALTVSERGVLSLAIRVKIVILRTSTTALIVRFVYRQLVTLGVSEYWLYNSYQVNMLS